MTARFWFTIETEDGDAFKFTKDDGQYLGYFEDDQGLQYVLAYSFEQDESRLYIGHGEEASVLVWQGVIADHYIDGNARIWLSQCLAAIKTLRDIKLGKEAPRSTPTFIGDCQHARDRRGQLWCYSEPTDTWCLRETPNVAAPIVLSSARSWQRLYSEFGPLTFVKE